MKTTIIMMAALGSSLILPAAELTPAEAEEQAKTYVSEEYELKEIEKDEGRWEAEFLSETAEADLAMSLDGKLIEFEYERIRETREKELALSDSEVKKIILKEFPGAEKIRIRRVSKKKVKYYKVKFKYEGAAGEAEISGVSGVLNEYELKYGIK